MRAWRCPGAGPAWRRAARRSATTAGRTAGTAPAPTGCVLVTHESFVLPKKLQRRFEQESGYDLVVRAAGDAGALTNKLVLTKDNPLGDVAFGVDNTFASRALDEGVFAPYDADLPDGAEEYLLPGDGEDGERALTPVDNAQRVRERRRHLVRRARPRPAGVARRPRRPGVPRPVRHARRGHELAGHGVPARHDRGVRRGRLAGLVGRPDGQRRQAHRRLVGRLPGRLHPGRRQGRPADRAVLRLLAGVHRRRRRGPRPARCSTPASARSSTPACWPGADNPDGAEALVDFLLSPGGAGGAAGQHVRLPGRRLASSCPPSGREFAEQPTDPWEVDPAAIAEHRDEWLREWSDLTSR